MWFCESYSEAGHPRCVHTALPGRHTLAAGYPKSVAAVTLPDTTPVGLRLTDLKTPIRAGLTYPVVFTFARAGELRLRLGVDNPDQPREDCPLPANGRPPQVFTAPIRSSAGTAARLLQHRRTNAPVDRAQRTDRR